MKLLRYRHAGKTYAGLLTPRGVAELSDTGSADVTDWLGPEQQARAHRTVASGQAVLHAESAVGFLPPLAPDARLFCIGINYKDHAGETGRDLPPQPSVFIRTQQSVVGHGQALQLPAASSHYDYEGELAVVIGKAGRHIAQQDWQQHVAGYTCFNDGSLRDFQKHSVTAGKNFDASGACGPWIVTADELPDPTALTLVTRLSGREVQRSTTDLLIYGIPQLIGYLSQFTELRVGDVIATGTPAGVGARREPPLWMKQGDTVEVEISGIGILRNSITAAGGR